MSVIVTTRHTRQLKYCVTGMRQLFKRYELDFKDFLANGIDSELLLKKTNNDAMCLAAVELAESLENERRQ